MARSRWSRGLALCLAAWTMVACTDEAPDNGEEAQMLSPGVSLTLARHRAEAIRDLHYEVSLRVPEARSPATRSEAIRGSIVARFDLASTELPLVFDFTQSADHVLGVKIDGEAAAFRVEDEHVVIPRASLRAGATTVEIDFIAGAGSLNRNDDYLYTLFVPDRARVALPVFDQPDLKARFRLHLTVPPAWQAIANAELEDLERGAQQHVYHFAETEPIPTYLFAFAAGRFEVETAEREGRTLRLLHREPDGDKVARNLEAIFDLHAAALAWLEEYTAIAYPFGKFDFVAIPAFQYGGMEHPGSIFYRARSLFLDESATQSQLLGRASLIAHETAHMWFGNLVTMEWFNDVWMKEVLANFMAAKIVNPSFPEVDHDLRFLLAHYPAAYRVDRTAGANPIRQPLDNLAEAGSLYGAVIYQKAPVVMKHLELLIGEESFRDGLREYLDGHRYGNATWPDLIAVLDSRTEEDLRVWSEVWVNEPGRPTVNVELEVAGGEIVALTLSQVDPLARGRVWTQRLRLRLGYGAAPDRTLAVHLRGPRLEVAEAAGLPAPDFVLANGAGVGYGHFVLDERSRDHLLEHLPQISDNRVRAAAWLSLWESMLDGRVPPESLVDLAMRALESEDDELNVARLLADLSEAYWRFLPAGARAQLAPGLEELLWRLLLAAEPARLKAAYFGAYRDLALSPEGVARLRRIWAQDESIDGLPLSDDDMTQLAQGLAVRGVEDAEAILEAQLLRITNPDLRARFEFERPSLSADASGRDRFFDSLRDPANREHEPWVTSALGFLHHPLRAEGSEHLIRPGLEMLEEIQRTGDIFFPLAWLTATLDGHRSASAAAVVQRFLDENPDLPPRLRGKLLQAADPLFRAVEIGRGR